MDIVAAQPVVNARKLLLTQDQIVIYLHFQPFLLQLQLMH
jgi:hypothetical protein